mgnify:CR=1 FL=1
MGVATAFDLVRMRFEMAQPLLISLLSGLRCVPLTGNRHLTDLQLALQQCQLRFHAAQPCLHRDGRRGLEMLLQGFQHHLAPAGTGLLSPLSQGAPQLPRQFQLQESQMPPRIRVSQSSCRV